MEIWKTIDVAPDYEVSSLGRVRRVTPYRTTKAGKILTQSPDQDGYLTVGLAARGWMKSFRVNVLVTVAFKGPKPSPKHVSAHWDGNRTNNTEQNLRWATHAENMQDRRRHGTYPFGENNPNAELTDIQVQLIRAHYTFGETNKARLGRLFGVTATQIYRIVTGRARRSAGGYLHEQQ